MKVEELILENKDKVRRDSNLMSLYLKYFKEAYNYTPSCAGCSFNDDWNNFVLFYSKNTLTLPIEKIEVMEGITIKKVEGKIIAYKKDGITYRKYDSALTPEFIDGYLSNGTDSEITERTKLFNFPKEKTIQFSKTDVEILENSFKNEFTNQVSELINEHDSKNTDKNVFTTENAPKKRGRKSKK